MLSFDAYMRAFELFQQHLTCDIRTAQTRSANKVPNHSKTILKAPMAQQECDSANR